MGIYLVQQGLEEKTVNKRLREGGEVSTTRTLVLAVVRAAWWDDFEVRLSNSDRKKIRKDQMKDSKAGNIFLSL